ncbi:class I SAM-dependent methyltransferase [Thalassococcus sp. BH17M4-6]|uniref:class I SAM-dependent methyltransferase n=1 Tax=Thalassococcus sp. BH17M4-6 TaxID=3413148 RepID=UPI003BBF01B5
MDDRPLSECTKDIYDRHAAGFDRQRGRSFFEQGWIDRALADVPPGGAVLDLGCGAGEPVARYLIGRGFAVTGADFAPAMLDLCRARFPDADWRLADMRTLDLGRRFDAIIGWNSFFHLTEAEQRAALPRIAGHLAPGGRLLLTVGPDAGKVTGTVDGQTVFHASLAPREYRAVLARAGSPVEAFVPEDPTCHFHSLLLARRPR